MRPLAAAAVSCTCFCAAVFGVFVPLRDESRIGYLYAWPGGETLALSAAAVVIVLVALYVAVTRLARRSSPEHAALARAGRWLAPLMLPGLVLLGLAPAVPGSGEIALPLGYFFYDLRWWWLAGSMVLVAGQHRSLVGSPAGRRLAAIGRWPLSSRRRLTDAAIFTAAIACAIAQRRVCASRTSCTAMSRSTSGIASSGTKGAASTSRPRSRSRNCPRHDGPALHRLPGLLLRSIGRGSPLGRSDLSAFAANPRGFRWNRASGEEGFVRGWRGGVYQIYQPGVSFALFPGYLLDRWFSPRAAGLSGRVRAVARDDERHAAADVRRLSAWRSSACCVTRWRPTRWRRLGGLAMLTLPTAAFAFQFYPELPGLLLILLVSIYVLFTPSEAHHPARHAAGTGAAALAWLHPRFLLVSALLAVCGLVRSNGRGRMAFGAAAGLVYLHGVRLQLSRHRKFPADRALGRGQTRRRVSTPGRVPLNLIGYALRSHVGPRAARADPAGGRARARPPRARSPGRARSLSPPLAWRWPSPLRRTR